MAGKGFSVAFASLLLVGQLLLAVTSNAMPRNDGLAGCPCCGDEAGMTHASHAGDGSCATPGPQGGTVHDCGQGCEMHAAGHCGFGVVPAASGTAPTIVLTWLHAAWDGDLLARVPDSPLFDFLRPPN